MKLLTTVILLGMTPSLMGQGTCTINSGNSNQDFCTVCSTGTTPPLVDGVFTGTLIVESTYTISADCLSGISFAGTFNISMGRNTDLIFEEDPHIANGTNSTVNDRHHVHSGFIRVFNTDWVPVKNNNTNNYDDLAALLSNAANNRSVIPAPSGSGQLPVTLTDWHATANNIGITVNWTTANERHSDYFVLEHSTDGRNFSPLYRVSGATDRSTPLSYSYRQDHPAAGTHFYRLRQFDLDGTVTIFPVVTANYGKSQFAGGIFPNPAAPGQAIHISGLTASPAVALYRLDGQLVARAPATWGRWEIPHGLQPGVYLLRAGDRSERLVVR